MVGLSQFFYTFLFISLQGQRSHNKFARFLEINKDEGTQIGGAMAYPIMLYRL